MSESSEPVMAVLASTAFLAALVGIVMIVMRHRRQVRELLSRERMAALEKGVEIPWELEAARPRRASRLQLKSAFVVGGMGLGLIASSAPAGWNADGPLPLGLFLLVTGFALFVYDTFYGRHEWRRATELDEELTRAYIRRLDRSAPQAHDARTENVGAVR